ncbi:MAG: hypothetical protein V1494_04250 [Candidatus Diapherotrites archaeon]
MQTEPSLDVIDIHYGVKQVVRDELEALPEEYTLLVVVTPKSYEVTISSFMDYFLNGKKLFGTYITTNKPFRKIMEKFLREGIKAENLFFIDCVTREATDNSRASGVKVFSSQNVTEMTVVLDKVVKSKKIGGEFIFLDSVSTLLVYNDEKTVEKFVHAMLERIYFWRTKGVFITVETSSNKQTIENLSLFFDKTIRIE